MPATSAPPLASAPGGPPGRSLLLLLAFCGLSAIFSTPAPAEPPSLEAARDHHLAGRLDEAERAYRALLGTSPPNAEAATAHNNLCLLLLNQGRNDEALDDCRAAVVLRREQGVEGAQPLARSLNNLALVDLALGRPGEARRALQEALELNRRHGQTAAVVQNLGNLGSLAVETGDFGTAMGAFQEAEALAQEHPQEPWAAEQLAIARINQGVVLEQLGAYRRALDLYEPLAASPHLDAGRRASLALNVGVLYRNLGDPVRAVAAYGQALEAFRQLEDSAGQSLAWLDLGLAYHLNLARPEDAADAYRRALDLARAGGQRRQEIETLCSLGRLHLDQGRGEEAREAFEECRGLAEESGSPEGRWTALEGLGRVARTDGRAEEAVSLLEEAVAVIEGQRSKLQAGEDRQGYFGSRRSVYEAAVEAYAVLAAAGDGGAGSDPAARGLELVQLAKARELLESLGGGVPLPRPLKAEEILAVAGDALLLELFAAEGRLYGWTVHGGKIRLRDLGSAGALEEDARALHRILSQGEAPPEEDLGSLSRALLAPLEGEAAAAEAWIVAADGVLRYLPFELLISPATGRPLVEDVRLSYLPSASALASLPGRGLEPALRFAGFGAPARTEVPGADLRADLLLQDAPLPALGAAAGELRSAARRTGGNQVVRTGADATEQALAQVFSSGAHILHLATHTVMRETGAGGAAILLSPGDGDDGLLVPEEIAALQGRVDLTVLAACSSALGTASDSRALSSLTGAFLTAGSRSVIASLWDVDDAATAAFMEQLYYHLGRGVPPAEALRRTKQRLLRDPSWSSPHLWAPFVIIGPVDDPPLRRSGTWWMAVALAGLVLLGLWWWLERREESGLEARAPSP